MEKALQRIWDVLADVWNGIKIAADEWPIWLVCVIDAVVLWLVWK